MSPEYYKAYYRANREKILQQKAAYRKAHPNQRREWGRRNPGKLRATNLKRYYGLSPADVQAMLSNQGGACALCEKKFSGTPCVDHCHSTGKVRGLLCHGCNTGLGKVEKVGLDKIRDYLFRE